MSCYLCGTTSKKIGYLAYVVSQDPYKEVMICTRCWDDKDGDVGPAVRAKASAQNVKPCKYCKRIDFENDFQRRAHQGRCPKNPDRPKPKKGTRKEERSKRKRSEAGRMSRRKGARFENRIKRALATWWGENPKIVGTKTSAFQRSPGSGGTSPKNWPLDIYVPPDFPWAVECKNREGAAGMGSMERFLRYPDAYPIITWFRDAENELVKVGIEKPLLLIATKNQFGTVAALRRPVQNEDMLLLFPIPHITLCGQPFGELVVCGLPEFLKWMTPAMAKEIYENTDSCKPIRWEEENSGDSV